jgi:ankyrin repeat protein
MNPNYEENTYEEEMLFRSARERHVLSIAEYLNKGKGNMLECRDKAGQTPLIIAAANGKLEAVEHLLNKGADINAVDKDGCSALFRSALFAHVDIVQYLISKDANIHSQTRYGETALSHVFEKLENSHQVPPELWMGGKNSEMHVRYFDIYYDLLEKANMSSVNTPRP